MDRWWGIFFHADSGGGTAGCKRNHLCKIATLHEVLQVPKQSVGVSNGEMDFCTWFRFCRCYPEKCSRFLKHTEPLFCPSTLGNCWMSKKERKKENIALKRTWVTLQAQILQTKTEFCCPFLTFGGCKMGISKKGGGKEVRNTQVSRPGFPAVTWACVTDSFTGAKPPALYAGRGTASGAVGLPAPVCCGISMSCRKEISAETPKHVCNMWTQAILWLIAFFCNKIHIVSLGGCAVTSDMFLSSLHLFHTFLS